MDAMWRSHDDRGLSVKDNRWPLRRWLNLIGARKVNRATEESLVLISTDRYDWDYTRLYRMWSRWVDKKVWNLERVEEMVVSQRLPMTNDEVSFFFWRITQTSYYKSYFNIYQSLKNIYRSAVSI